MVRRRLSSSCYNPSCPVLRHGGVPGQQEDPNFEDENWLKIGPQTLQPSQVIRFHLRLHMPLSIRHKVQHDPYRWSLANAKLSKASSFPASTVMFKWKDGILCLSVGFRHFIDALAKSVQRFCHHPCDSTRPETGGVACWMRRQFNRIHSYLIYMLIIVNQYTYYIYTHIIWLVLVAGFNPVNMRVSWDHHGSSPLVSAWKFKKIMVETTNSNWGLHALLSQAHSRPRIAWGTNNLKESKKWRHYVT